MSETRHPYNTNAAKLYFRHRPSPSLLPHADGSIVAVPKHPIRRISITRQDGTVGMRGDPTSQIAAETTLEGLTLEPTAAERLLEVYSKLQDGTMWPDRADLWGFSYIAGWRDTTRKPTRTRRHAVTDPGGPHPVEPPLQPATLHAIMVNPDEPAHRLFYTLDNPNWGLTIDQTRPYFFAAEVVALAGLGRYIAVATNPASV